MTFPWNAVLVFFKKISEKYLQSILEIFYKVFTSIGRYWPCNCLGKFLKHFFAEIFNTWISMTNFCCDFLVCYYCSVFWKVKTMILMMAAHRTHFTWWQIDQKKSIGNGPDNIFIYYLNEKSVYQNIFFLFQQTKIKRNQTWKEERKCCCWEQYLWKIYQDTCVEVTIKVVFH